jgi:multiple sugar transport system permease protein
MKMKFTAMLMAGSVMTVLPVLILFIAVQKHCISGIMAGSVKE